MQEANARRSKQGKCINYGPKKKFAASCGGSIPLFLKQTLLHVKSVSWRDSTFWINGASRVKLPNIWHGARRVCILIGLEIMCVCVCIMCVLKHDFHSFIIYLKMISHSLLCILNVPNSQKTNVVVIYCYNPKSLWPKNCKHFIFWQIINSIFALLRVFFKKKVAFIFDVHLFPYCAWELLK